MLASLPIFGKVAFEGLIQAPSVGSHTWLPRQLMFWQQDRIFLIDLLVVFIFYLFNRRVWSARDWEHDDPSQDHREDAAGDKKLSLIKSEVVEL